MDKPFEEDKKLTPCQCSFKEGKDTIFCNRHECVKTKHLHSLCQQRQEYFELWEKGEGPMQNSLVRNTKETGPVTVSRELLKQRDEILSQKKKTEKGFFEAEETPQRTEETPQKEVGFFETDNEEYFMGDENIPKKSVGLGDTVAKFTKITGIDKLVKSVAGKDCGCKERQSALNRVFPYKGRKKTKGFFE